MKTYFVDAFTNEPFKGNPAGVCFLEQDISKEKMQIIAKEIGFSETAFIKKNAENDTYDIRFFSPKKEIALCGHATLSSAKVLFETTREPALTFITGEKLELNIRKENDQIVMAFPIYEMTTSTAPASMLHALGLDEVTNTSYSPKNKIMVLEISDSDRLASLKPDFNALIASYEDINGVLVTASSKDAGYDFHYRYFWPWAGTNEDPVTGGVQTFLTKYWASKLNKTKLKAFQSSERTGFMTTELKGDKVLLFGNAVIMLEGQLKNWNG